MKPKLLLSAAFLGALLMASCSNDAVEDVNYGDEITFNTRVTRATDLTTGNLESFKVWGMWPRSDMDQNKFFIDGQIAKKESGSSTFNFERSVFWPNDVSQVNFWAIAPEDKELKFSFDPSSVTLEGGFKPAEDQKDQKDLIVAYQQAMRDKGTNVSLTFQHALSRIEVYATAGVEGGNETKKVWLKGAWIVNIAESGTLTLGSIKEAVEGTEGTEDNFVWKPEFTWNTTAANKTNYGRYFDSEVELSSAKTIGLFNATTETPHIGTHMLLVPQQLAKWDINDKDDKEVNAQDGAYIVLLCRVEATHKGTYHETIEGETTTKDGAVISGNGTHTHQMFPYTGDFNGAQYGYTCVPINTKWEPGKKYIYTLTFCGQTSGAGIYPPAADIKNLNGYQTNVNYKEDRPNGKKVGDPVLDNPISFTVTVADWDDKSWTNGNIDMN